MSRTLNPKLVCDCLNVSLFVRKINISLVLQVGKEKKIDHMSYIEPVHGNSLDLQGNRRLGEERVASGMIITAVYLR